MGPEVRPGIETRLWPKSFSQCLDQDEELFQHCDATGPGFAIPSWPTRGSKGCQPSCGRARFFIFFVVAWSTVWTAWSEHNGDFGVLWLYVPSLWSRGQAAAESFLQRRARVGGFGSPATSQTVVSPQSAEGADFEAACFGLWSSFVGPFVDIMGTELAPSMH